MPLKKSLLEVPAADGLAQKYDPRSLPVGKSAKAINYVKNKQGRLEKRLGLFPLPGADPFGSGFALNKGVKLTTWGQELLAVGTGLVPYNSGGGLTNTGQTMMAIQTQSDDLAGMVTRGPMPELKLTSDQVFCNTPNTTTSITSVSMGDYLVFAWIAGADHFVAPPFGGSLYWCAIEKSTGNFVVPTTLLDVNLTHVAMVRLAVVNAATVVCCYSDSNNLGNIYFQTLTKAALATGLPWTNYGALITTNGSDPAYSFDMRSAGGDPTNFLIAYVGGRGGSVVVDQRPAAAPATITATFTVAGTSGILAQSFGIRADISTVGRLVVAYGTFATIGVSTYSIAAATATYPAMTSNRTATTLYTAIDDNEPAPWWLDVAYGGSVTQPTWCVSHSPYMSAWNAGSGGVNPSQSARPRIGTVTASACARIIQNMMQEGVGAAVVALASSSGANAIITPGVVLASRGLEANGTNYYLGWVPSLTQGSFLCLANDQARLPSNASIINPGTPMRPCGTLQTRTALADPGLGSASTLAGVPAPNSWTGGSEWVATIDSYGTSYVAYVGGTAGQRLQPAYGAIQTTPTTGYPASQWGSMTALGGILPVVFAGQNAVEQGYLYVPESIIVVLNGSPGGNKDLGPTWTLSTDSITWIFCWEWFDEQGNFHQSARSTPVVIAASDLPGFVNGTAMTFNPTFYIPSLGTTLKQWPVAPTGCGLPFEMGVAPAGPVTLGCYRTGVSSGPVASTFFRINDRFYNGDDPETDQVPGGMSVLENNSIATVFITQTDVAADGSPPAFGVPLAEGINDGTHPLLYGDGTNGAPGSLDNFNPPATPVMVLYQDRLFVARGNQLLFTKQRGQLSGPGYNEQVNSVFIGNTDPILGADVLDGNLIVVKAGGNYYINGPGPADDGSGSVFSPQIIPTDIGCASNGIIKSTPQGLYYQSTGGLRRISRSLAVEYVGGPVEDELTTYPVILDMVLYPQNNRLLFLANTTDAGFPQLLGENVVLDYALDAWTTAVLLDGATQKGFVSSAVAMGKGAGGSFFTVPADLCLHLMTADGVVWREHNPLDQFAYFDNQTYISSTWLTPLITLPGSQQQAASKQGRFRLWDILALMQSMTPHGLIISVGTDYGPLGLNRIWVWNSATGAPSIAPGGSTTTPLTQLRTYHGPMGEAFQVQVQDVSDPASTNGQGAQLLGLTLAIGTYPGPYKVPASATQ